jgi:hypothetical protein
MLNLDFGKVMGKKERIEPSPAQLQFSKNLNLGLGRK